MLLAASKSTMAEFALAREQQMSDREFSKEFQKEAIKQVVVLEHSVESVSARLGVPEESLINWVDSYIRLKEHIETSELDTLRRENKRLSRELKLAQEELELLRKARRAHRQNTEVSE